MQFYRETEAYIVLFPHSPPNGARVTFFFFIVVAVVLLFRTTPEAYGSSQAKGNTGSLTHWARPRIEPTSSWILVGFISEP